MEKHLSRAEQHAEISSESRDFRWLFECMVVTHEGTSNHSLQSWLKERHNGRRSSRFGMQACAVESAKRSQCKFISSRISFGSVPGERNDGLEMKSGPRFEDR